MTAASTSPLSLLPGPGEVREHATSRSQVIPEDASASDSGQLCSCAWLEELIDTGLGLTALAEDAVWLCRARSRGRASAADLQTLAETGMRAVRGHLDFWRTCRSNVDREPAHALLIARITELGRACRLLEQVAQSPCDDRDLDQVARRFDRIGCTLLDGVIDALPLKQDGGCPTGSDRCHGTVLRCR